MQRQTQRSEGWDLVGRRFRRAWLEVGQRENFHHSQSSLLIWSQRFYCMLCSPSWWEVTVGQWFSIRDNCVPQWTFGNIWIIFGCCNCESATGTQWVEARAAGKPSVMRRMALNINDWFRVHSARAENPGFRLNPTSRLKGECGVC